jgi:hypothetical protein
MSMEQRGIYLAGKLEVIGTRHSVNLSTNQSDMDRPEIAPGVGFCL